MYIKRERECVFVRATEGMSNLSFRERESEREREREREPEQTCQT